MNADSFFTHADQKEELRFYIIGLVASFFAVLMD